MNQISYIYRALFLDQAFFVGFGVLDFVRELILEFLPMFPGPFEIVIDQLDFEELRMRKL